MVVLQKLFIFNRLKKNIITDKQGKDLSLLLTGKVSLEYDDVITSLIKKRIGAVLPKYITTAYTKNKNTNVTVDFILNNLLND